MKYFFQNASKVTLISLVATIIVLILLMCLLTFADNHAKIIHIIGKVFIAIALPFLILNPLFGFIYSFFTKGKSKILLYYYVLPASVRFRFLHL